MRRMLLVGAVAAVVAGVVVVAGSAVRGQAHASSSALTSSEILAPADSTSFGGRILELKADAGRAFVVVRPTGSSPDALCADGFVWRPSTGKLVRVFDDQTDCAIDGGINASSFGVALAGNDAAWVESGGGHQFDTELFVSSLLGGRTRRVDVGSASYDGDFVVNPHGDGALLVYNSYERCALKEYATGVPCPPGYPDLGIRRDSIMLALPTPAPIAIATSDLTVLTVGGGRVVASLHWDTLIVLAVGKRPTLKLVQHKGFKAARLIATYPYKDVVAAATDGRTLAVLGAGVLDVIPLPGSPGNRTRWALPKSASYGADRPVACLEGPVMRSGCTDAQLRLVDLDGHIVVYLRGNAVYLLDLTTDRNVIVARPVATPVNAQLEPDGLYIAAGRTLTFTPRSQVEQRLHR